MPLLLRRMRRAGILTSKSPITLGYTSQRREELFGEAGDECASIIDLTPLPVLDPVAAMGKYYLRTGY